MYTPFYAGVYSAQHYFLARAQQAIETLFFAQ